MFKNIEYSVVLPVFNEQENLVELQRRLANVMYNKSGIYEVIYVDDSSTDQSLDVLQRMKKDYLNLRVYSFSRHRGQSAAFYAGFTKAKGRWIITLDADLQNPPEEIDKLLALRDRYDFIVGIRRNRSDSRVRIISSRVARFFRRVFLGDPVLDTGCSLKCFRREILNDFIFFNHFHRFMPFLVSKLGYSVGEVEVKHMPRTKGRSKYNVANRLFAGAFDLFGVFWLYRRFIPKDMDFKYEDS